MKAVSKFGSPSLPARPTGPPSATVNKWWGKWFLLALALAVAGGLTKRAKILA